MAKYFLQGTTPFPKLRLGKVALKGRYNYNNLEQVNQTRNAGCITTPMPPLLSLIKGDSGDCLYHKTSSMN